jgi:hypothetical protein
MTENYTVTFTSLTPTSMIAHVSVWNIIQLYRCMLIISRREWDSIFE